MTKRIDIGAYSAYAIAVEHGFVGTEEEWLAATDAARIKAEAAQLAAETAQRSASSAQGAAETARDKAKNAQNGAEDAQRRAENAQSAAESAQGAAETARDGANTARSGAQSAQGAAEAAKTAAETARSGAQSAQGAAEAAQTAAAGAAGSAQESAQAAANTAANLVPAATQQVERIEAAGAAVLASIPEDYSALSNQVTAMVPEVANSIKKFYTSSAGNPDHRYAGDSDNGHLLGVELYGDSVHPDQLPANWVNPSNTITGRYDSTTTFNTSSAWFLYEIPVLGGQQLSGGTASIRYDAVTISGVTVTPGTDVCVVGVGSNGSLTNLGPLTNKTYQIPNTINYIIVSINTADLNTAQIEYGSQATAYKAYSLQRPSPLAPQSIGATSIKVRVSGSNLFRAESGFTGSGGNWTDVSPASAQGVGTKVYIDARYSKTFSATKAMALSASGSNFLLRAYDANKVFLRSYTLLRPEALSGTVTVGEDVAFVRAAVFANTELTGFQTIVDTLQPMLVYGAEPKAYVPYTEQSRTITPPKMLCGVGEYRDVCDTEAGVWRYNLRTERVYLASSAALSNETHTAITVNNSGGLLPIISTASYQEAYRCTHFGWQNIMLSNDARIGSYIFNRTLRMRFPKSVASTLSAARAWLETNPVYITYATTEAPTTEVIDADDLEFLRSLESHYGGTLVAITDQDDNDLGASFLYPCSLEQTVEYVKQQLGDDRKYIYDLDYATAVSYVNSEYAAALAELSL